MPKQKTFPLPADKIDTCPPHYWFINTEGIGHCFKCGEQKKFYTKMAFKRRHGNGATSGISYAEGRELELFVPPELYRNAEYL